MYVLSLFDGLSGGQIALQRAGIKVGNYYASEIDPYGIAVAKYNYINTIHVGDVTKLKASRLPKIDLLIGGSPCQSFSNAGKGEGFDGESGLFREYYRLLKELQPKYFLLENVKMKMAWRNLITARLFTVPIEINSSRVSAQLRSRLYWTNIPKVRQPKDKGMVVEDILEPGIPFTEVLPKEGWSYVSDNQFADVRGKAYCLRANAGGVNSGRGITDGKYWRKLTVLECERLQTLPEGYTEFGDFSNTRECDANKERVQISNTQRHKMIGNGWTIDVIAHIFSNIPRENKKVKRIKLRRIN